MPRGARRTRAKRLALALAALGVLGLATGPAHAAPQILGIVASNGLPTPLHCVDGLCSAHLASFCLQEARYSPAAGSEYRLLPGGRIDVVVTLASGGSVRLPGERLLQIRTRSGFSSLGISLPESKLRALGAVAAAIDVGPGTTILPVANADDPNPQSAEEIAAAAGPLRRLAATTFEIRGEGADTARVVQLMINDLPALKSLSADAIPGIWRQVAATARQSGIQERSIAEAGAIVDDCRAGPDGANGFASSVCLELRQAELMTRLNRRYWDDAAAGS